MKICTMQGSQFSASVVMLPNKQLLHHQYKVYIDTLVVIIFILACRKITFTTNHMKLQLRKDLIMIK